MGFERNEKWQQNAPRMRNKSGTRKNDTRISVDTRKNKRNSAKNSGAPKSRVSRAEVRKSSTLRKNYQRKYENDLRKILPDSLQKKLIFFVLGVILIAVLFIFSYSYVKGQITQYHQAKSAPSVVEKMQPIACTADNLDVKLEIARRSEGAGAIFKVIFTNRNSVAPCLIDAGYSNVKLQVLSGNEKIWNSQVCAIGEKKKQLLISKGVTSKQSYVWNGLHAGADCKGTGLAQAGGYRVNLSINNKTVIHDSPFAINKNGTISIPVSTVSEKDENSK